MFGVKLSTYLCHELAILCIYTARAATSLAVPGPMMPSILQVDIYYPLQSITPLRLFSNLLAELVTTRYLITWTMRSCGLSRFRYQRLRQLPGLLGKLVCPQYTVSQQYLFYFLCQTISFPPIVHTRLDSLGPEYASAEKRVPVGMWGALRPRCPISKPAAEYL